MSDAGYSALGTGCKIQDAGFRIQDARCKFQEPKYTLFDVKQTGSSCKDLLAEGEEVDKRTRGKEDKRMTLSLCIFVALSLR